MSFSDLPNVRDTLGEHPCEDWCPCGKVNAKAEELKKDRRLENWEKWTTVHKKLNDNLSETLLRGPCRTLMNSANDLRTINEEKAILEYAKIPNPHDKYRGNPAFWKTPEALPDLCNPKCPSNYLKVMTKEEKCEIPDIEYVTVPDYIRAEMGYHCWGVKESLAHWNALEYRQRRVEALKNEISNIEPYKPDLNNLYIEGKTFKKEQWRDSLAEIKLRLSTDSERMDEAPAAEYYVQVNDIKITTTSTSTNKIIITFNYDIDSRKVATEYLKVNNATPLALRYHFERCVKHSIFTDIIPEVSPNMVFFFNMNEEIIPPNNSVDIPIWFKTNKDGIYKESWKFCTQPAVWTNDLIIIFEGVAFSESLEEKCAAIKLHLNEKAQKRLATKIIDEVLSEIPRPEGEPILYTYDRAMVFEAANQNYDPFIRRPKYLYNRPVVDQLEEFYARVKLPSHPDRWNYNIEDLRSVTKQKECYDYEQKMLLEIEAVKKKELEKSNLKEEEAVDKKEEAKVKTPKKKKHKKKKEHAVEGKEEAKEKTLNEQSTATTAAERPLSAELEEIIMKLEQPSVWINLDRNKYEWTYEILCGCIDKICEEMDEINNTYFIDRTFKYPKLGDQTNISTERTAVEFLGDALTPGPFRIFGTGKSERVPPERLKDIPMEDTMKRYKTYYGISDDQEKKSKKKGKKGKKKKKKKEKKAKGVKRKKGKGKGSMKGTTASSAKVEYKINENFDPYGEIEIPSSLESESSSEGSQEFYLQPAVLEEYNERTYSVFYTNLESAIMRIFNVLENQNNKQIKLNVFKTVLESNKRLSKPVKLKAMDLKQAINESFDLQEKITSSPTRETKPRQFWISEAIERKEEGSLWSILRGPKQPEIQEKPISYPEEQVIFKRRHKTQQALNEVGTIMSNAGIDPFWEDFKDVQTQTLETTGSVEEDNIERHVHSRIEKIMVEVFKEVEEEVKCPEICKCDEGSYDEDSFYDDEIPEV